MTKSISDDSQFCPHCRAKAADTPSMETWYGTPQKQHSYGAGNYAQYQNNTGCGAPSQNGSSYNASGYYTYNPGNTYNRAASVTSGSTILKPKKELGKNGIIGICAGGGAALMFPYLH